MDKHNIKHLLRIGLWKQHDLSNDGDEDKDWVMEPFYMCGPNVVSSDTFGHLDMLPKIMYNPPDGGIESSLDLWWSVAACVGPVSGGITMLPFSFRPWKIRYVTSFLEKEEIIALCGVVHKLGYNIPKETLKQIYKCIIEDKTVNRGFRK